MRVFSPWIREGYNLTRTSDACASMGGTCQNDGLYCRGSYFSNMCPGAFTQRCCTKTIKGKYTSRTKIQFGNDYLLLHCILIFSTSLFYRGHRHMCGVGCTSTVSTDFGREMEEYIKCSFHYVQVALNIFPQILLGFVWFNDL